MRFYSFVLVLVSFSFLAEIALAQGTKKKKSRRPRRDASESTSGESSGVGNGIGNGSQESESKAGHKKLGIQGHFGLQIVKFSDADIKTEVGGYVLGASGVYILPINPKLVAPLGLGLSRASMSGESTGDFKVTLRVEMTSIVFEGGLAYYVTPNTLLGGFLAYYYGVSGSTGVEFGEFKTSNPMASSSQFHYGARGLFRTNPSIFLGGDFALLSGSFKSQASETSDGSTIDFSGYNIRFIALFVF